MHMQFRNPVSSQRPGKQNIINGKLEIAILARIASIYPGITRPAEWHTTAPVVLLACLGDLLIIASPPPTLLLSPQSAADFPLSRPVVSLVSFVTFFLYSLLILLGFDYSRFLCLIL